MLKLIDVFIIGFTNSLSFFPPKITDYSEDIAEIQAQLNNGYQTDAQQLANDKLNIYTDLSKAYKQLTNEFETEQTK